jgi:hypothetical protein
VTSASSARTLEVRHLQIARAAFAAIAAVMVTFSPDHSAVVGMAVFSGFATTTGLVLLAAVWVVYPTGRRWPAALLGTTAVVAGMIGGIGSLRTITGFFVTVIAWAVVSGLIEALAGWRELRLAKRTEPRVRREIAPGVADPRPFAEPGPVSESRDGVVIGIITLLLAVGLLLVPTQYVLNYTIDEAPEPFTLTGITIGVGIFGAYAAIVAVYLAIAGFSPRTSVPVTTEVHAPVPADQKDPA